MKISYSNQTFEKQKTPRYIYHFTNRKAYNSMLNDGFIRAGDRDPYNTKPSVYAVDLVNFMKFWGHHKSWDEKGEPLQESLFRAVVKWFKSTHEGASALVLLRIPTKYLDSDKLKIRSQHLFFETLESKTKLSTLDEGARKHLQCFTPASETKRYTGKKKAIEYVYQKDIPIDFVTRIGEIINIPNLRNTPEFRGGDHAGFILSRLLEGCKEARALCHLKH